MSRCTGNTVTTSQHFIRLASDYVFIPVSVLNCGEGYGVELKHITSEG